MPGSAAVADHGVPHGRRSPALVFAVSRPLASGWLGLAAGGQADTTIILLDRSPSMQQAGAGAAASKLETGRQQLAATLATLGSVALGADRQRERKPRELESPAALLNSPPTPAQPAPRPTCRRCCRPPTTTSRPTTPAAPRSGSAPTSARNDWNADSGRWQIAARRLPRVHARRPLSPARLSRQPHPATCRSA